MQCFSFKKIMKKVFSFYLIGFINTVFGFFFTTELIIFFSGYPVYQVSLVATLFCIIFSFLTYQCFHFKLKKNVLIAFFKFLITYSLLFILNAFLLTIFIDVFMINIYSAQFLNLFFSSIIIFFLHNYFTFKHSD